MQTLSQRLAAMEGSISALRQDLAALQARVTPQPPTPGLANAVPIAPSPLSAVLATRAVPPRVHEVIRLVAEEWDTTVAAILSARRDGDVTVPRAVAMALALEVFHYTTTQVGRWFGRDHSTVISARQRVAARCKADEELGARVDRLAAQLRRAEGRAA